MEAKNSALVVLAPIMWGANYAVTAALMPPDYPLLASAARALIPGLLLLAIVRELPKGSWWWRSLVAGMLSIGGFFVCVFVAAQRLPSGVAACVMGLSPIVMAVLAHWLAGETLRRVTLVAGAVAFGGVVLIAQPGGGVDVIGLVASAIGLLSSAFGFILVKRWSPAPKPMPLVAWQLTWAGLVLTPLALVVEGVPATVTVPELLGLAYICLPATGLAYLAWFHGLARLNASVVGLIGAINPIVGLLTGVVFLHERLTAWQALGVLLIVVAIAWNGAGRPPWRPGLFLPRLAWSRGAG